MRLRNIHARERVWFNYDTTTIRGVNLGGWFVLERSSVPPSATGSLTFRSLDHTVVLRPVWRHR